MGAMNSLDFERILEVFSEIQEDGTLFTPKLSGWSVWILVKDRIQKDVLESKLANQENSFLDILFQRIGAFSIQLVNAFLSYFKWHFTGSWRVFQPKRTLVLYVDGFFLYRNGVKYAYPFGEAAIQYSAHHFDTFVIQNNNRKVKKKNVGFKSDIEEDFICFSGIVRLVSFPWQLRRIRRVQRELFAVLRGRLKAYPQMLAAAQKSLFSFKVTLLLFLFPYQKQRAKELLALINPFAILMTCPYGYLHVVAAAKELRVPVIEYQHGVLSTVEPNYCWPPSLADQKHRLLVPDKIYTWGEYWKAKLLKARFWSPDELENIGYVKIDELKERYAEKSKPGSGLAKGISLVFTSNQFLRSCTIPFFQKFLELAKSEEAEVQLNIKIHPDESHTYEEYLVLSDIYPGHCSIHPHGTVDLYTLFMDSHIHLSIYSASILESIELGIPTAILDFPGNHYFLDLIEDGTVRLIKDPRELYEWIGQIESASDQWSQWMDNTRRRTNYCFSHNANGRIIESLTEIHQLQASHLGSDSSWRSSMDEVDSSNHRSSKPTNQPTR